MKIYGHRGASGQAPENTMESFMLAHKLGCDGMETDIHQTKDGILVLMHDEKIDRTTTGKGYIKDYTYQELLRFNANYGNIAYSDCKIPTLEQLLVFAKNENIFLHLEIKTDHIFYPEIEEKIVAMVKLHAMDKQVVYSSFNHYSILKVKELDPNAKVSFLYEGQLYQPWQYAKTYNIDGLHPNVPNMMIENYVAMCHLHDLEVNVWTVNHEEEIKQAMALGVDGIFTNDITKAKKILG